jgi:protocatechuate 3,4-dioxygenase beta subunit
MDLPRRHLLASGAALAAHAALSPAAAALLPTPRQTAGPFYPLTLPLDADNDLVQVAGRAERARGTVLHLAGRLLDPDGRAVPGARIEIWQCDAAGVYHHPRDPRGPADPNFQGFGATTTEAGGGYRFRTIEPVAYPGRTPHIHFTISGPGFERLTTQMYVAGQPQNARDFLYRQLGDGAARDAVTVALASAPELEAGAKSATFDIVLGVAT